MSPTGINFIILFQCEFERRKPDGTTTLGLLNPVDLTAGGKLAWFR